MSQSRLRTLDALRGVAALTVLAHHVEREFSLNFGFAYGYLAVDLFFLISGFVVAGAYEARMDAGLDLGAFLLLRLKRLYPMILAGAALGLVAAASRGDSAQTLLVGGVSALTLIPLSWSADVLFPINIPEWSLFYELIANLLHRILKPVLTLWGLVLCVGLSVLGLAVAGWKLHALANGWSPGTVWGGFPRVFFSYALGVLLYRLHAAGRLGGPAPPAVVPVMIFLGIVVMEGVAGRRVAASAYWLAAVAAAFPIVLVLAIRTRPPLGLDRIAGALGDLSYPLYAVHVPLLVLADPLVLPLHGVQRIIAAALVALVVVLTAVVLNAAYDAPVRRWLAGAGRHTAAAAQ